LIYKKKYDKARLTDRENFKAAMPTEAHHRKSNIFRSTVGSLKGFFTSVRLALFLIAFLTGLSLLGSLLIQAPAEVRSNLKEYAWWLDHVAYEVTGSWTGTFALLQFFNIFTSPWFLSGSVLLILCVLVCTSNRLKRHIRIIKGIEVRRDERFYAALPAHSEIPGIQASTFASLAHILKKRGYRTKIENDGRRLHLAADKNRFASLGTYLSHFSIIILISGVLIGNFTGFYNPSFIVTEGEKRNVGFNTGLSLYLDSFTDEYWENGAPKDYRSVVILYKDTDEVRRSTVRVNHPLGYGGVRFYQSFFGSAARLQVKDKTGKELYSGSIPLTEQTEIHGRVYSVGMVSIPDAGLAAYVIAPPQSQGQSPFETARLVVRGHNPLNSPMPPAMEELQQGKTVTLAGADFTYLGMGKFSGFQVKRDPGTWLVWLASILFVLGTAMVFYFPYRTFWAMAESKSQRSRLLLGAASSQRTTAQAELEKIVEAVRTGIKTQK